MGKRILFTTILVFLFSSLNLSAQYIEKTDSLAKTDSLSRKTVRKIDRGINAISFAYKNEVSVGLSVSYQTLNTDDANLLVLLDNINVSGSKFTIKPSVGYFVKDNLSIGARFGYAQSNGRIDNISVDLGPENDLSLSLTDIGYKGSNMMASAYMRSYAGIDKKGHFGLFAELELRYETGNSQFSFKSDGVPDIMKTHSDGVDLMLKAGAAVYFLPNVMCHLSFGLGGIGFNKIVQKDDHDNLLGNRVHSKMSWKLNLLDIALGFSVHL